jgi:outer membrane protein OmpA-like peptidoglycan-associated protein
MRLVSVFLLISTLHLCAQVQPVSLSLINTAEDEQSPVITPDGKSMYFTVGSHAGNVAGKRDPGDIWYSTLIDNEWSAPVHAGTNLNNRLYNAVAGFSADGSQMFLLCHYSSDGQVRSQGISVSHSTGTGWSTPENITIPYFQNKSSLQSGHVSSDGKVFVFSAETYGSYGVEDIYVSLKGDDGKWSEPKNLGRSINTQLQELTPSMGSDGVTLYFSSNGKRGMGSFDVFKSTRLDDSWTKWSEPENIGAHVNTEGRELYVREYYGFLLYTSTINSDGYGDIKIFMPKDLPPLLKDTATTIVQQPQEVPPLVEEKVADNMVHIHGTITDAKTSAMVHANIAFQAEKVFRSTTEITSGYNVTIPSVGSYVIKIESPGYISTIEKLDVSTLEMNDLEMNFQLQPIEVGTTVNLKSVLFAQSKPDLLTESYDELDLVVDFMKANPGVKIELGGHTDNRGIQSHNVRLSTARVNTVKNYLVSHGIDKKRINGKGYGGTFPIASNDDEETRRLNRRVEFTIKKR